MLCTKLSPSFKLLTIVFLMCVLCFLHYIQALNTKDKQLYILISTPINKLII